MINKKFFIFVAAFFILGFSSLTVFGTTITVDSYAWNDIIGWIDFYNTPGTINITPTAMTGYASSTIGYIAFDCATSPTPPADCAASFPDWKITRSGSYLSGWAWNDNIGWISFSGTGYQVEMVGGEFIDWAWNDIVGWISFNCINTSSCATLDYAVKYSAEIAASGSLTSSTFDTGLSGGAVYNTIMYQGSKPTGTGVTFQLATSNCANGATNAPTCDAGVGWGGVKTSGDGAFLGYDGTSSTYYSPTDADVPIAINSTFHNNKRYFRYKIILTSNTGQTETPQVDQIIVNWSR